MTKQLINETIQIQLLVEYHIKDIMSRIVHSCCDNVSRMIIIPETFQINRNITHDEYQMHMLCKSITFSIHVIFDIDEDAIRGEINELVFNCCEFDQSKQLSCDPDFIHMVSNVVIRFLSPSKMAKLKKEAKKQYQSTQPIKENKK